MPVLLPNATVSTSRKGQPMLANVLWKIWPMRLELQIQMQRAFRLFQFNADRNADIQVGDVVTGYNPTSLTPAPSFVVKNVVPRDGLLPHLEGIIEISGPGALGT